MSKKIISKSKKIGKVKKTKKVKRTKKANKTKQHYVPRFYLKSFAYERKPDEFIIKCFNKETGEEYEQNTRQVAMERYFYEKRDIPEIEDYFSHLEGLHSAVYHKIVNDQSIEHLTLYDKGMMCHYIKIQNERTRSARTRNAQIYELVYKYFEEEEGLPPFDTLSEEDKKNLLEGGATRGQINFMFNPVEMEDGTIHYPIETIFKMVELGWILLKNDLKKEFYTSDHPVRVHIPRENKKLKVRGFGSQIYTAEGVEIYFPLTPRLCLVLYDKEKSEYRHFGMSRRVNKDELDFINRQIIAMAHRTVFTRVNDFKFVRDCVKEYKDLKDLNRFRIIHG